MGLMKPPRLINQLSSKGGMMVEDIYKNKLMTFEDIDRLSLK